MDRNEEIKENVDVEENSLNQMENAIKEGNLGFFSPDNIKCFTVGS